MTPIPMTPDMRPLPNQVSRLPAPEETKSKTKPVKKDLPHKTPIKQKGNEPLIFNTLQEYFDKFQGIGVIKEQMALRKIPGLKPKEWKQVKDDLPAKQKLIKLIYEFDKKK